MANKIADEQFAVRVMAGVHPRWAQMLLDNRELRVHLMSAVDWTRRQASVEPPPHMILECMRYCAPEDVRVVIVGQDPYTNGNARGLSFATSTKVPPPPSLKNVLAAVNSGLRPDEPVQGSDLRPWAAQGVLLLNRALTVGADGASHLRAWKPFTDTLVGALCRQNERHIAFMLWGKKAQELEWNIFNGARGRVQVFKYSHPSPVSDNKLPADKRFNRMRDFAGANEFLERAGERAIAWTPRATRAASDGACAGNGRDDARATFSVMVGTGQLAGCGITGVVAESTYRLIDDNNPLRGFYPTGTRVAVTNNRAEYLGGCCLLLLLLRSGIRGDIEIVLDTKLFIESLLNWLPKRRVAGTEGQMKNFDLLYIAEKLYKMLKLQCNKLDIKHIKSHQQQPLAATSDEQARWRLNDAVDKRAGVCLRDTNLKPGHTRFVGTCWIPLILR